MLNCVLFANETAFYSAVAIRRVVRERERRSVRARNAASLARRASVSVVSVVYFGLLETERLVHMPSLHGGGCIRC